MNEPKEKVPAVGGVPVEMPPPPADDEFLGSRANNPFVTSVGRGRNPNPRAPMNPFKNKFEPEG
jgi:hypothetical protein